MPEGKGFEITVAVPPSKSVNAKEPVSKSIGRFSGRGAAPCIIVIVFAERPAPVNVTVATLSLAEVLASAVRVILALPVPLVPVTFNQV